MTGVHYGMAERTRKVADFYGDGAGDRLFEQETFPPEIHQFLRRETALLRHAVKGRKILVEVGCQRGILLDWATNHGLDYLGIDLVQRYIDEGRAAAESSGYVDVEERLLCDTADHLTDILARARTARYDREDILLVFPFNSFGNMDDPVRVIANLAEASCDFFISTYRTDYAATVARFAYYLRCGYRSIDYQHEDRGIRFANDEGFSSCAFDPAWLSERFTEAGCRPAFVPYGGIGLACTSARLEEGYPGAGTQEK